VISRRGFFAVLAGVLAAPKALFAKKEVLTVAKINELAAQENALEAAAIMRCERPVFMGRKAGMLAYGLTAEQVDEINRQSAEKCRRLRIPMLKA